MTWNKYGDTKTKKCRQCGTAFIVNKKYSMAQWAQSTFCGIKCAGEYKRKKDGYKDKYERYRRKKGSVKQKTEPWLELIRARTKEAMYRPEIQAKIHKPRSPMTLENKIKRSNALAGKMPKNLWFGSNNNYANVQRGDYECSKGTVYFRSKWEANYALYLDFLISRNEIEDWEYEADCFMFEEIKLGTRSYRPDFKVFNHDGTFEYHEVKGYMDAKSKTKLKRMAKYYPEVKVILVDKDYYLDLKKKMGKMLNFYD